MWLGADSRFLCLGDMNDSSSHYMWLGARRFRIPSPHCLGSSRPLGGAGAIPKGLGPLGGPSPIQRRCCVWRGAGRRSLYLGGMNDSSSRYMRLDMNDSISRYMLGARRVRCFSSLCSATQWLPCLVCSAPGPNVN